MPSEDRELLGAAAPPPGPDWLWGLIRGIRRDGVVAKDPRVKRLWDLLRSRGVLARSQWLKLRLRYIWGKGLTRRPRPHTSRRLKLLLRRWGILPPLMGQGPVVVPSTIVRAGGLRPVRRLRLVTLRRVGRVRPVGRRGWRR